MRRLSSSIGHPTGKDSSATAFKAAQAADLLVFTAAGARERGRCAVFRAMPIALALAIRHHSLVATALVVVSARGMLSFKLNRYFGHAIRSYSGHANKLISIESCTTAALSLHAATMVSSISATFRSQI